uniref:catalase n=1 Tax=Hydrogenophaga pseudoflava TaxID=47421 RepID=UPI0035B18C19
MTLDRNPDNFFEENEMAAFSPMRIVPGMDFCNDPLLQGRLFSYLDTQLHRLGGPNFQQLPINRPRCPMANFQRDGFAQTRQHKGQVAYEPNTPDPAAPRVRPPPASSRPAPIRVKCWRGGASGQPLLATTTRSPV